MESFRLAIDPYGNLKLGMQVLAVGAMKVSCPQARLRSK